VSADALSVYATLALTLIGVTAALAGWWKWVRPRLRNLALEAVAMRDAILGRDPVVDSITGRVIGPALPGIGVRMAHQEDQMVLLTDAVSKIADSYQRIERVESRVGKLEDDVASLKEGQLERIMAHAESASAWSAMEAAVGTQPPRKTRVRSEVVDVPLSRQPSCRMCAHEEHVFTACHAELGRSTDEAGHSLPLLCPCPPHRPTGIYD